MKRTKLYKLIIAVLVVINAGMLIFFLSGRPPHRPPHPGQLSEKLGLEGEKKTLVMKLEKEHHTDKRSLMKKDRELHEALFSKIGTDEDVSALQAEIEVNHAEIEKMTYDFFNNVSKHCTSEQKAELKKTVHRAFHQIRGPKKPGM